VWLHGRGDTGKNWANSGVFNDIKAHGFITEFPTASPRSITCNGGEKTTAWFDMVCTPVRPTEPESPEGIDETVSYVHKLLHDLEAKGTPPDHIVLGGYSQGGASSLIAGLTESLQGSSPLLVGA